MKWKTLSIKISCLNVVPYRTPWMLTPSSAALLHIYAIAIVYELTFI